MAWLQHARRRQAAAQLRGTNAVALGAATVVASKDERMKIRAAMRALLQEATGSNDDDNED